ncbi:MAG: DUF1294 domain-containing protein [Polyangiaceae bacterium]|nr:DUF1294 domain-containing protein [Polyangiaceae bacterium]
MALYGWDKRQARRGGRRIRERTLLLAAACFGAFGALLGMRTFRHKTKKPAFAITVPVLAIVYALLLAWVIAL